MRAAQAYSSKPYLPGSYRRGFLSYGSLYNAILFLADRLGPPLDILLDSLNCTAFSVQWKMPKQHSSTITGYTVSDAPCCCLASACTHWNQWDSPFS